MIQDKSKKAKVKSGEFSISFQSHLHKVSALKNSVQS